MRHGPALLQMLKVRLPALSCTEQVVHSVVANGKESMCRDIASEDDRRCRMYTCHYHYRASHDQELYQPVMGYVLHDPFHLMYIWLPSLTLHQRLH